VGQKFIPKLVRDKIPQIIQESGRNCKWHCAEIPEYNLSLYDKMREELTEFMEYPCVEEAADMYEVFLSMLTNWGLELSDVISHAEKKKSERGGFSKGIVLDSLD
jgi:predicted house-cleaning noncanonical NTP pyrophosphatase (MazG superfamily)